MSLKCYHSDFQILHLIKRIEMKEKKQNKTITILKLCFLRTYPNTTSRSQSQQSFNQRAKTFYQVRFCYNSWVPGWFSKNVLDMITVINAKTSEKQYIKVFKMFSPQFRSTIYLLVHQVKPS